MDLQFTLRNVLLIAHIGTALILIGPLVVATSLFPRHISEALADPGEVRVAQAFHRITKGYGNASIIVALIGAGLAFDGDLWSEPFVGAGIALFLLASAIIFAVIVPAQTRAIGVIEGARSGREGAMRPILARMRMASGITAILWLVLLYFMVAKPS